MSQNENRTMTYEEYDEGKSRTPFVIIGKVILLILVIGTVGILLWRVITSGDPASMKTLAPNEPLVQAYAEAAESGRPLDVWTNEYDNITRVANRNYGYFSVTQTRFIEDCGQLQLVFRYNNSTLRHLAEDYGLEELPDRTQDQYDVTLVIAYDLTPDDLTDNDGNQPESVRFERIFPSSCVSDTKTLYNYRLYTFDGVNVKGNSEPVLAVYVDIYYKEDIDYEKDAYGTLWIYDYSVEKKPYTLTDKDVRALTGTTKK